MKVQCESCKTIYDIPDSKIPEKGAKTKCKNCQGIITIKKGDIITNTNQDNQDQNNQVIIYEHQENQENKKQPENIESVYKKRKVYKFNSFIRNFIIRQFDDLLIATVILIFLAFIFIGVSYLGFFLGIILGSLFAFLIVIPTFGFIFTIIDMRESLQKLIMLLEKNNELVKK